jgi:guanine deaminase
MTDHPGHLVVEDGFIVHIDATRPAPSCDLGGEEFIVSPGFVDTHLHLPQFDSIGADNLELLDWLDRVIFAAELKWNDVDYARAISARVADELHSFGTTSIAAYATSSHASTQAALDCFAAAGFAGHIGQVLMDRNAPESLLVPSGLALGQAATLQQRGDIAPAVTPRFAIACSPEMLRGAGRLAMKTGWYVQTHLAETQREIATVQSLFPNKTYTQVYEEAGLLTSRTLLGHGIYLAPDELALLHSHGSTIAHCPTANRFLDSGTMDWLAYEHRRLSLSLGSDIGAGPDRSMIRVARAAIDASKQSLASRPHTPPDSRPTILDPLSAEQVWWTITAGNAEKLGLTKRGHLATGTVADLLLIRPTKPLSESFPIGNLLYGWDDRWLHSTLARGRVVWRFDR